MIPLWVDLDGTLIKTDMLWEGVAALLKQKPWQLLRILWWAVHGKAHLKHQLAAAIEIDVAQIPLEREFVAYLQQQHALGRPLYLLTGANVRHAELLAQRLGLFTAVYASTATLNMSTSRKLQVIREHFGQSPFAYAGNAHVDMLLWRVAQQVVVVNPVFGVLSRLRAQGIAAQLFTHRRRPLSILLRQLRVHQWTKNLLIFFPLLLKHEITDVTQRYRAMVCFGAFCLVASSTYVLNDLLDLDADRRHHQKRQRPLAAGDFPIAWGFASSGALLLFGLLLATELTAPLGLFLLTYCATTSLYSFCFKKIILIDVGTLVFLYILRLLAGAEACNIDISNWALAFFSLLFSSLALAKRYAELHRLAPCTMLPGALAARHQPAAPGRDYAAIDLNFLGCCGISTANTAVLVCALYINTAHAQTLYAHPQRLWLLLPLGLYWLMRVWLLAYRGMLHEDPIYFAVHDRTSYVIALLTLAIGWLAT